MKLLFRHNAFGSLLSVYPEYATEDNCENNFRNVHWRNLQPAGKEANADEYPWF
ncbi:hypothetical protein DK45_3687 [Bordetella bronchiseptica]|nr:hypothetical protein DK45_3687 [Bordetella bronchiseptica]